MTEPRTDISGDAAVEAPGALDAAMPSLPAEARRGAPLMDEHMAEARRILTAGLREARKLTPRAQAEAAHHAGGHSVDELEQMVIRARIRDGHLDANDAAVRERIEQLDAIIGSQAK